MNPLREPVARAAAVAIGAANAAVTGFWLVGGTALLSTVGGEIERWGRERGAGVLVVLAVVLLVKASVACLPIVLHRTRNHRRRRWGRTLAWVSAIFLAVYGGLLSVVGLLVQFDVLERSADADDVALAWHAFFWDPWFLIWGLALAWWLRVSAAPADGADALTEERSVS